MNYSKILFIRRDNIGDLICTTPAIRAVKEKFPYAKIGVLVNSYNAEAVRNSPDIDKIYVYKKAKHTPDKFRLSVWFENANVLRKIRKERYDAAIGCGSYSPRVERYTRFSGAKMRIGYIKEGAKLGGYNSPLIESAAPLHEVQRTFGLLAPLGITGEPSHLRLFPSPKEREYAEKFLKNSKFVKGAPVIALNISSRRPENRWPVEKFIKLAELIYSLRKMNILLLWSPGSRSNLFHPGDDEKANEIINRAIPGLIAYRTSRLKNLVAILSLSDAVICCDGGAMHAAAALGKPVVAIWGSTDPKRWRPWGVEHRILQKESREAKDVGAEEVFEALKEFLP
ncbi:MAG: glycosyltransferase family 9 protein [Nitrospirae bacterium]|nr:glycosyltransferase family 9 protein [Nitrospirota bacterium]